MKRQLVALGLTAAALGVAPMAPAEATTCTTDASLPAPVAATVVDGVGTVQGAVEAQAGALPVDVAGTLGSQLGCSSTSSEPGTQEPGATVTPVSDTTLPVAAPASPVTGHVAFTG